MTELIARGATTANLADVVQLWLAAAGPDAGSADGRDGRSAVALRPHRAARRPTQRGHRRDGRGRLGRVALPPVIDSPSAPGYRRGDQRRSSSGPPWHAPAPLEPAASMRWPHHLAAMVKRFWRAAGHRPDPRRGRSPRLGPTPAHWTTVDRRYETLRIEMEALFTDLALTPQAA